MSDFEQIVLEPDRAWDDALPVTEASAAYSAARWRWAYNGTVSVWFVSRDDAVADAHVQHPGVAVG